LLLKGPVLADVAVQLTFADDAAANYSSLLQSHRASEAHFFSCCEEMLMKNNAERHYSNLNQVEIRQQQLV
jgi:hypothetical protein